MSPNIHGHLFNHCCFLPIITVVLGTIFLPDLGVATTSNLGHAGARLRSDDRAAEEGAAEEGADEDDLGGGGGGGGIGAIPGIPTYELTNAFLQLNEIQDSLNDSECGRDIAQIVNGVKSSQMWSLKMLDSFGKPRNGFFHLNFKWSGSYQECINLVEEDQAPLDVQFCWLNVHIELPSSNNSGNGSNDDSIHSRLRAEMPPIKMAICVPKSCSSDELLDLAQNLQDIVSPLLPADAGKYANISDVECAPTERNYGRDRNAIMALIVVFLFVIVMTAATVYDLFYHQPMLTKLSSKEALLLSSESDSNCDQGGKEKSFSDVNFKKFATYQQPHNVGKMANILLLFSIYTNGKKLFRLSHPEGSLECLNGIRFLSMTWVILGHTYLFYPDHSDNNGVAVHEVKSIWYMIIFGAQLAVDSFLTLSGCLVGYHFLRYNERVKGKISWLSYYGMRYIRLTPPFLAILLLRVHLMDYLSSGPFWKKTGLGLDHDACVSYWWANMLYVQNMLPLENQCMEFTWYLAVDTQCYVVVPIILIYLVRKTSLAAIIGLTTVLASSIVGGLTSAHYGITMKLDIDHLRQDDPTFLNYHNYIYTKMWIRIPPFIIGIGLGTILHRTKCRINIGKLTASLGWILAVVSSLVAVFLPFNGLSVGAFAIFTSVHRVAWSLSISWLILACCTGYGGIVNHFLSWPALVPLSTLSYCAYLIHFTVMQLVFYNEEVPFHYTHLNVAYFFIGSTVLIYAVSIPLFLAFEAPLMDLKKIIFRQEIVKKGGCVS